MTVKAIYTRETRKGNKWVVIETTEYKGNEYQKLVDRAYTWVPIDRNRFDFVRVSNSGSRFHEVATSKDGKGLRVTLTLA